VIYIPKNSSPLTIYHFSFYLYHILKELIPFEIQCKILHYDEQIKFQHNIDCFNNNHLSINTNDNRDYSYTLFRSSSIYVTRQKPLIEHEQEIYPNQSKSLKKKINYFFFLFLESIISIATVHYIECSLYAFFVLILYTI
jgi:hypothetical protein